MQWVRVEGKLAIDGYQRRGQGRGQGGYFRCQARLEVAHGGALFPGVMPLMVAILAALILGEAFTRQKAVGLSLIVLGALVYLQVKTWRKFDWRSFKEQTEGVQKSNGGSQC